VTPFLAGVALMALCAGIALNGDTVAHFLAALFLLGVGWNFMYTGGTMLLTESYAPAEKARTQGINDFIVLATMAISSASSGALVSTAGWERVNRAVPPFLVVIGRAFCGSRACASGRPARVPPIDPLRLGPVNGLQSPRPAPARPTA
jgi:MFS family permease